MSTTLSMTSRQFAPSTRIESQVQSLHSSEYAPSIRGMVTCSAAAGSLRVVPDEQLPVLLQREPGPGPRGGRHPPGVGDARAPAVAAPAPVVERAGDLVALDRAAGQVAAHVPAVRVEHVQVARRVREHHQLGAERLHRVRAGVAEPRRPGPGSASRARTGPAARRRRWSGRRSRSLMRRLRRVQAAHRAPALTTH